LLQKNTVAEEAKKKRGRGGKGILKGGVPKELECPPNKNQKGTSPKSSFRTPEINIRKRKLEGNTRTRKKKIHKKRNPPPTDLLNQNGSVQ